MTPIDYGLYLTTLVGAAAMYVFSLHKGFNGCVPFLKRMFPGRSTVFYDRLDFLLVSFLGSFIGYRLLDPQHYPQALTAGLCWVSAVNVVMKPAETPNLAHSPVIDDLARREENGEVASGEMPSASEDGVKSDGRRELKSQRSTNA
ncbi:hypothetical protein PQR08_37010 [Caballeronia jiangsuensis]|uniref:Uncharacterized protein n=1 Tax=Caballeronia jiangsuensis TaxID=1458357 RepID=A0ABW9CZS0_9BURK